MTLRATTIGLLLTHVVAAGDPARDVIVRLKGKDPGQAITAPYSANRNRHQAMLGAIENRHRVRVRGPACATLHDALQGQMDSGRDLTITAWHDVIQARCSKRSARGSCSRPDLLADLLATYVVKPWDAGADLGALCAALSTDPDVHVAEPNHAVSVSFEPDDPLLAEQWALSNIGQAYPVPGGSTAVGAPDADIDAPEAWDVLAPGGDAVVVAVLDTGVDYNHPDLAPAMWTDGGGLFGFDFVNNDDDPMDDHGHGTHCAGITAAASDNGVGVAGVCPNARIMALKFLDAGGHGYTSDATDALYYAVAQGADVISNSWGGGEYSETLETAINYAHSQGVILVAAAGNADSAEPIFYPANYSHVLAIAATDAADRKAYFSNHGTWIDLSAPGVDILSVRAYGTDIYALHGDPIRHIYQTDYYIASGTSMACPHVAGGLALLMTHHLEWTPDAVIERLRVTTDDIALLNPAYADGSTCTRRWRSIRSPA